MKKLSGKILFHNKAILVLSFAITLAVILTVMSVIYAQNYESKNRRLKTSLSGIQSLSKDIVQIKAVVESKEKKIALKQSAGVVSTLENILKTLGLEAQVIKPLGKSKINEFTEDNAELEIQGADLNSIVNLLYIIDISPAPMKIKAAAIKTTFEDPDKFIFKLTISLMSKG